MLTATDSPTQSLPRPQPIGVGDFPDALLLHATLADADGPDSDAVAPSAAPAVGSELSAAIEAYNALVTDPSPAALVHARAHATGEIVPLTNVAAYATGMEDEAPSADSYRDALDGELLAHALIVTAAWQLDQGRFGEALAVLQEAADAARAASPVLAAQALTQRALVQRDLPNTGATPTPLADIARTYEEAITLAGEAAPPLMCAEWQLQLATVYHEAAGEGNRAMLLNAVRCYQSALRNGLSERVLPDAYALAHTNLALAYLAMPTADATQKLRPALALQSLRAALTVYKRETHPEEWARTQMHLANALVYVPTGHAAENLMQAVDLFEELLSVRDRALDPLGYARVLANQANALAHLGVFADAVEKLNEAHKLFHWHGEESLAAEALEQLERITVRRAEAEAEAKQGGGDVTAGDAASTGNAAGGETAPDNAPDDVPDKASDAGVP